MKLADRFTDLASSAGVGAMAALAGTAAMTVSSTLEAKLRHRQPSQIPADVAASVLGVVPKDDQARRRLSNFAHWAYGTSWGAARGLLGMAGMHGTPAAAAHLAVVWGAEQVVLPATGASRPAWKWKGKEVCIDLFHHAVYAAFTSMVYDLLDPHRRVERRRRWPGLRITRRIVVVPVPYLGRRA